MSGFDLPNLVDMAALDLVFPIVANDDRSIELITETPNSYGPLLILTLPD